MATSAIARRLGQVLFIAWIPVAATVGASLMSGHWTTLPTPAAEDDRLPLALAELRSTDDPPAWMIVHVLYAACSCSGRVVEHLLVDPRPPGLDEKILWIGSEPQLDARVEAGPMPIVHLTPQELDDRFAIEGAPLLLVVDPQGVIRYRGGYTDRKQSLAIRDIEIIERLRSEAEVTSLPLFGCAVSDRLRDLLDPFGVRRIVAAVPTESP
jgi:hypothetical protein